MTIKTKALALLTVSALSLSFNAQAMGSRNTQESNSTVNEHTFKGKWDQIKGQIQKQWGKLTNDDMDKINGNIDDFYGKVEQYYGETKEAVNEKLDKLMK